MINFPEIDYSYAPNGLRGGLEQYIENHIEPGSFLRSVLENNLLQAALRADGINAPKLHEIVMWLYDEAPDGCWGSPAKVKAWLAKRPQPDTT